MILTTIWTLLGSGMNDRVWALNTHNNEAGGYFKTRAVIYQYSQEPARAVVSVKVLIAGDLEAGRVALLCNIY